MRRFIPLILISLFSLHSSKNTFANDPLFQEEIYNLRLQAYFSPIDTKSFREKWEATLKELKERRDDAGDLEAETSLNLYMQSIIDLLKFNYDSIALDLVYKYASDSHLLELADWYFYYSNHLNRFKPNNIDINLLAVSTDLYEQVWNKYSEQRSLFIQEYQEALNVGTLGDLNMQYLLPSKRKGIKNSLTRAIDKSLGSGKSCMIRLADLPFDISQILGQHVMFALNPFLPEQIKSYGWLVNRMRGNASLTKELYDYCRQKAYIESQTDYDDFKTWLQSAAPRQEQPNGFPQSPPYSAKL